MYTCTVYSIIDFSACNADEISSELITCCQTDLVPITRPPHQRSLP